MTPDLETPTQARRTTKAPASKVAIEATPSKSKKAPKREPAAEEGKRAVREELTTATEAPKLAATGEDDVAAKPVKRRRSKNKSKNNEVAVLLQAPISSPHVQVVEIPAELVKDGVKTNQKRQAVGNDQQKKTDEALANVGKKGQAGVTSTPKKKSHPPTEKTPKSAKKSKAVVQVEGSEDEEDLLPEYRIYHPGGGTFLPIEPAFSKNEMFMFLALPHALRVYSTKTSLLHRIFSVPGSTHDLLPTSEKRIVSYCLDPADENNIFITTYSGNIFLWNWVEGQLKGNWDTKHEILLMEVCVDEEVDVEKNQGDVEKLPIGKRAIYIASRPQDQSAVRVDINQSKGPGEGEKRDLVVHGGQTQGKPKTREEQAQDRKRTNPEDLTDELIEKELKRTPWEIFRVTLEPVKTSWKGPSALHLQRLHKFSSPIVSFKVLAKGTIIVAISGKNLWIGNKAKFTEGEHEGGDKSKEWGKWHSYAVESEISCMDVNIFDLSSMTGKKVESKGNVSVKGYVAVGDVKGKIHLWHNILDLNTLGNKPGDSRRLHWHRNAVGSVKISKDGNYLISGGNETVLVLWQIDTGHKQFLPHLTSAIEHIVVSPSGASYAIRLSDNSVMVLSTTDLKPKANIAGIQAASLPVYQPNQPDATMLTAIDLLKQEEQGSGVPQLTYQHHPLPPRVPCTLYPTQSNQLLLATSSHSTSSLLVTPAAAATEPCPYLQTYDTFSDRPVSKQALTRTHATDVKIGPTGNSLVEPNIRLLSVSTNGEWLASLDEWSPPPQDAYDYTLLDPNSPSRGGREVYLKFWRRNNAAWELVTRVDSPHPSAATATFNGGAKVLDLVALPSARNTGFASLGADGSVRIWKPRVRTRGGVVVKHRDLEKGGVKSGEDVVQVNWGCRKVIHFLKGNAISSAASGGALAVSHDGSVLAVAVSLAQNSMTSTSPGTQASSAIYILDPVRGITLHTLLGLQPGTIASLRIINRYLVILGTNKLILFDLVRGRVKWELPIANLIQRAVIPRPEEMFMDADPSKGTVAVGVNFQLASACEEDILFGRREENKHCHWGMILSVFDLAKPKPMPVFRTIRIGVALTALKAVPAAGNRDGNADAVGTAASGYLYLDSFARVNYLTPATVSISQTAALLAPEEPAAAAQGLSSIYAPPATGAGDKEDEEEYVDEGRDARAAVPAQALSNALFSYTGVTEGEMGVVESMQQVYGMMDLSEVFDRVMGLYALPALAQEEEDREAGQGQDGGALGRMDVD